MEPVLDELKNAEDDAANIRQKLLGRRFGRGIWIYGLMIGILLWLEI